MSGALTKALAALALGRRWTTEHLGNCSEDDHPYEVRKIKEDLADIDDAIVALAALTPSPTPYVRPAAEIQAEIERLNIRLDEYHNLSYVLAGKIAALNWTLTPPTQEPKGDFR